ncbi:MAG: tRNA(Ile)-lysidine synthetase [Desulfovibrionales bacterium]|nr:tRNA(Ile)-lysidine synthetase [Desulfovibrionales bacterium]
MANMKHGRALWERLLDRLQILGRFTLGYSGGIDSRFLAHAAIHARVPVELVHGTGPHIAPDETAYAARWAEGRKLPLRLLYIDPLQLPAVAQGGKGRCYVCKRHLFEQMAAVTIGPFCDGSNASDASLFRPGQQALREFGIHSPLAEAGLDKPWIRDLARLTGLEHPGQQARACLLTRLPYGVPPTQDVLSSLARGEHLIGNALAVEGLAETPFRLRLGNAGHYELHVETPSLSSGLREVLGKALTEAGFHGVDILAMATVSGYFDQQGKGDP